MKKYNGWPNLPTIQFKEIISELVEAKDEQKALMIIANTGDGKTNAIKAFKAKNPKNTFVFTLGDSYNLLFLLNDILSEFGLRTHIWKNAKHKALKKIAEHLKEIGQTAKPILILDEAENAKVPTLKAIKELYDTVHHVCSIVLIGTPQLTEQLNKKAMGKSIPQLRRRFKAGTRYIQPFNKVKDMKAFFDLHIPTQYDLQDLLISICDNYGELHDYLHPFLVHCDKRNIEPTEAAFRLYHKIPKIKN